MKQILRTIDMGRLIGVTAVFVIAAGAVVAVPFIASAGDDDPVRDTAHDITISRSDASKIRIEGLLELNGRASGSLSFEVDGPWQGDPFALDLLEAVADLTGAEVDDVVDALADGQSLAEYAEEHGISADALFDGLTAAIDEKLDEAVEDGDLTEKTAERIRAEVVEHLEALVDGSWPMGGFGFGRVPPIDELPFFEDRGLDFKIESSPIDITAELTGTDPEEVVDALRDGQTLAEYAAEHGVSEDELVAAILEPFKERLDEAVAESERSQAEADEILESIEERMRDRINSEGRGFGFGHEFGPGGHFMPFGGIFEFPGDCRDNDGEVEETSNQF